MSRRNVFTLVCAAVVLFPLAAEGQNVSIKRLGDSGDDKTIWQPCGLAGAVLPNGDVIVMERLGCGVLPMRVYKISDDGKTVKLINGVVELLKTRKVVGLKEALEDYKRIMEDTLKSVKSGELFHRVDVNDGVDVLPNGIVFTSARIPSVGLDFELLLTAWKISEDGKIQRLGDASEAHLLNCAAGCPPERQCGHAHK